VKIVVPKFVKRIGAIAAAIAFALIVLRAGIVSAARLAVGLALVYGGLSLAGSLIEKVWCAARRLAHQRQARFPRVAAAAVVGLVLFTTAFVFSVTGSTQFGYVVTKTVFGGLLLVGGFLAVRRWLSVLWDAGVNLFHKDGVSRGQAQ
jgi:hypothetical protein